MVVHLNLSSHLNTWLQMFSNNSISSTSRQYDRALLLTTQGCSEVHVTPDNWMDSLPLIILRIQTALKGDISSTAVAMVYGTTYSLPAVSSPATSHIILCLSASRSITLELSKATSPCPTVTFSNFPDELASATHALMESGNFFSHLMINCRIDAKTFYSLPQWSY